MATVRRMEELFGLDMLAAHLASFEPPQGPHDAAGNWQLDYRVYSLASEKITVGGQAGTVRLSRESVSADKFVLALQSSKPVRQGGFAGLTAEVEARATPLAEPVRWSWTNEIPGAEPNAPPLSRLSRSAIREDRVVKFSDSARKIALDGPCTINWLLMETVGRLPRQAFPPLGFTLLEDFDRPKLRHTLHYVETINLALTAHRDRTSESLRLHVYHHLGDGNMPWIYWVDDLGRLLFAVSGFEAYARAALPRLRKHEVPL